MEPAVEQAYIVPTTPPVLPKSAKVSLITIGETILNTIAGIKKTQLVLRIKLGIKGKVSNQSAEAKNLILGRMAMVVRLPAKNIAKRTKAEAYLSANLPPR